ncbi:MAG: SsrA-binding protein SmpB [Planctomycetes bacterium]|nr:SsrA-binding protein SmpB [Planctomycetota bacterium]
MTEKTPAIRVLAQNRKARHEYEILAELECGVELTGTEVKSLRDGGGSIAESYAMVKRDELWLVGSHVPEYRQGNIFNHVPDRDRRLLAHRREIDQWYKRVKEKGVTMVPLSLYFKGPRVKLLLGLCRGKKLHDKRATLKERDDRRDIERALSRRR